MYLLTHSVLYQLFQNMLEQSPSEGLEVLCRLAMRLGAPRTQ